MRDDLDAHGLEFLAPQSRFGRYRIVRRIGAGGMGAVYEGVHLHLKKRVAIKALLPTLTDRPELRARFVREGEAAARIRHPHVVDVYDVGIVSGVAYLVMELLEGEDLGKWLRRNAPVPLSTLADVVVPVCSAVHAAHEAGIIHRDLKPANIFLSKGPRGEIHPKVLDFGISKIAQSEGVRETPLDLTRSGAVMGTPHYVSPEGARGGATVDARADQYSLGVILYECVTGQRPFEAPSMYQVLDRIVKGVVDAPSRIRSDVPPAFEAVILRAMQREPWDRFSSVDALGVALLPFSSERVRTLWTPTSGAPSIALPLSIKRREDEEVAEADVRLFTEPPADAQESAQPASAVQAHKERSQRVGKLVAIPALFVALVALALVWIVFRAENIVEVAPAVTTDEKTFANLPSQEASHAVPSAVRNEGSVETAQPEPQYVEPHRKRASLAAPPTKRVSPTPAPASDPNQHLGANQAPIID